MPSARLAIVFLLAVPTGCGPAPMGTPIVDAGPPADADTRVTDWTRAWVDTFCNHAFACEPTYPTDVGITHEEFFGPTREACKAMCSSPELLQASVDAGRVIFDYERAPLCLQTAQSYSCVGFWESWKTSNTPACNNLIMGTVPLGGACTIDQDCVSVSCVAAVCVASAAPSAHGLLRGR